MSEVHNYLIGLAASRRTSFIPRFLLLAHFSLSFNPSATGDVGNLVLPVGMQSVSFFRCTGLTGTAELGYE